MPIIGPPAIKRGFFIFLYPSNDEITSLAKVPIFTLTFVFFLIPGPVIVIILSVNGLLYFNISYMAYIVLTLFTSIPFSIGYLSYSIPKVFFTTSLSQPLG